MSCNGCRVLRKGCSDGCVLRQCLRWIESPDAQGHATVFVAKFFGRAGMMALITSVPEHQRPALFQSLLYEACGRTINPVFGAVGLLCSGSWKLCQDAVDTVMKGGLLCPSSTGTGRPGVGFMPPQAFLPGRLSKVRLGRGGFTAASHAASGPPFYTTGNSNNANCNKSATKFGVRSGDEFSLDSSNLPGTEVAFKKRQLDHDSDSGNFADLQASKQLRINLKVEKLEEVNGHEEEQQSRHGDEDHGEHRGKGGRSASAGTGTGDDRQRITCLNRKLRENDGVVVSPRSDEVGLDLTLGSSSAAWETVKSNSTGGRSQTLQQLVSSSVAKQTNPGSPCHSSEADSDTTDLSISIQSHRDPSAAATVAAAAAAARTLPPPSTPPPSREVLRSSKSGMLLMDLLH